MQKIIRKNQKRKARHQRIRAKISGTTERPRLCVHRSLNNFYAQVVDDSTGKILFGMSTLAKPLQTELKKTGNAKAAARLGEVVASELKKKGIQRVCFDRGGYLYHGRVKAFAEAARQGGMEF